MTALGHELAIERHIAAPRGEVWKAVTERLTEWWCPRPWTSEIVALEWKSGGRFAITMRSPEGEEHAGDGMLLEVVPGERFVFTNMLGAGWTPQDAKPIGIVGTFAFSDAPGGGTLLRSSARHWSDADRKTHEEMGFTEGWGQCAAQLAELVEKA